MKKFLGLILSLVMLLSAVPQTFAAEDNVRLQFSDDFSNGNLYWRCGDGSSIGGGKLKTPKNWANIGLAASGITWKDFIYEFDFKLTDECDPSVPDPWFMFNCKGMQFFWRINSSLHASDGKTEAKISDSKLTIGTQYTVRVKAKDNFMILYLKKDTDSNFTEIGNIKGASLNKSGSIGFTSYYPSEIDNIKMYAYEGADLTVKDKISLVPVKGEYKIEISNSKNAKLSYESNNAEIATVDENGVVNGVASGMVAIDIKDEKGNVVETVGMKVYTPIESMKFEYNSDKTIYVGDQMGEDIEVAPAGALSLFDWSVDKNDVIEVYGSSNLRRGIIAKAPGEVTLTVKDKNGDNAVTKKITVLPDSERPKDEIGTTVLTKTGSKNKISDSFFGFHMVPECLIPQNQSLTVERMKELNTSVFRPEQALMQSVKNKENSNKYENWHQVFEQDYPIWEIAKQSGNRMSYVVDPISYDDESCIEQVKYLYEKIGGGYTLELGNEVYAIGAEERFPRAKDYFEWAKDFAVKVKSISPDITCVAVILSNEAEMRILADPYNNQMLEADWAYTQTHRVDEWNKTAEEYKDDFDGFISHNYASVESIAGYTGEEFLRKLYAYVTDDYYSILANSGRLGNKPMYITEWGNLAAEMFWGTGITNEDRIRFQWQMYPAAAIKNMEQLLNYAKTGCVTETEMHDFQDGQGFGVYAPSVEETPYRTVFKEIGPLLSKYKYNYDINGSGGSYCQDKAFYWGSDVATVVRNIEAWGLGDENDVKKVILSNHTNVVQTATLSGAQLKPEWSYGGSADKVVPDWMINRNYTNWFANEGVDTSLKPDTHSGAQYSDSVEIPPYTIMVCDVNGKPALIDGNNADVTSKITQWYMNDGIVLKTGSNYGYVNNEKKLIDSSDDKVMPVIKDDRTLLPLRFVSENLGCAVDYDDATKAIKISGNSIEINLTVGDKKYTVNGEEKEFDVEAMVENDRTLVPLRALAEALGKEVQWDNSGLIIITYPKAGFESSKFTWLNSFNHEEMLKILNLFQ